MNPLSTFPIRIVYWHIYDIQTFVNASETKTYHMNIMKTTTALHQRSANSEMETGLRIDDKTELD